AYVHASTTSAVHAAARIRVPDGSELDATASFHSGEPVPKASLMSPKGPKTMFSSSMFAVETPPKLHPARVNGTHGAGVVTPPSVTMFGCASRVPVASSTLSVQYLKEVLNC